MSNKEKLYIRFFLATLILILAFGLFSFAYSVWYHQNGNDDDELAVLELFYMGVHILFVIVGIYFASKALKSGSMVMRSLMFDRSGHRSTASFVVAIVLGCIGLFGFVYFGLVVLGVPLHKFGFGMTLMMDVINVGIFLFICAIFFALFPFLFPFHLQKEERIYTDENIL